MKVIDRYIDENVDVVHEDIISMMLIYGTMRVAFIATVMVSTYIYAISLVRTSKFSKKLTEKLRNITGNNELNVYIVHAPGYNSFNLGGNNCYILEDMLIQLNEEEIMAILLHEASHSIDKDVIVQRLKSDVTVIPLVVGLLTTMVSIVSPITSLMLFVVIRIMFKLSDSAWSKKDEYKSDDYAVKHGYGDELISALKKISVLHKVKIKTSCKGLTCNIGRRVNDILSTHPDTRMRIDLILKNKKIYKQMDKGFAQGVTFMMKLAGTDISKTKISSILGKYLLSMLSSFKVFVNNLIKRK